MNTQELLKKVRKIEIKTRKLSENIFGGEYHSRFKGRGMTFSEVRQYQYGDDIRNIHWNVTARYNEPYIKVFEEERELTLMLAIDVSQSKLFGSHSQTKKEVLTEIAATLAFSALKNNDKIGVLLFTDEIELFISPKKGKTHVLRIIRELLEFSPKNKKTNINHSLAYLLGVLKKKSIVFVLSDFMDTGYEKNIKILAKKHDLSGIRIYDKTEVKFPNVGLVPMLDSETNALQWVYTGSKKIRDTYHKNYVEQVNYFEEVFSKTGASILNCEVGENYVKKLLNYFKKI